jgi:hypothetical protein
MTVAMQGKGRALRLLFALIGWGGLIVDYVLTLQGGTRSLLGSTITFLSYFTILTNILIAVALTAPALAPDSRLGRWTAAEDVRGALIMYIAVVGLIYHSLLASTWDPEGLMMWATQVLHTVMPIAFLLDWLFFVPRGRLRWIDPIRWLSYPLLFGVWTIVHGLQTGWYPYWFIDIDSLGWVVTLTNFGLLLAFFLVLGLIVAALDRGLAAMAKGDSSLSPS